eukprot:TRINITY_DN23709_c0_g1_i1.p1 TRINITY_DN23709_c0_g1~~TRINITY_DN23709_c0_g1_i1.p1  ORF type:complete len:479 (-),score=73.33 TRINITY_DN23709_c0_g1_i1:776-2212(-)
MSFSSASPFSNISGAMLFQVSAGDQGRVISSANTSLVHGTFHQDSLIALKLRTSAFSRGTGGRARGCVLAQSNAERVTVSPYIPKGGRANGPSVAATPGISFRPPSQRPPEIQATSLEEQWEILSERRGLWFEYAPIVSSIQRAGFPPSVIDEKIGMNGVEQNTLIVAYQVYMSLVDSGLDRSVMSYFDAGGAEILYELRTLSSLQRLDAAEYVVEERMDAKGARELSKAIKEHERRRREDSHECFSSSPGDCLAFALFRVANECRSDEDRISALTKALSRASTDSARIRLQQALGNAPDADTSPVPTPAAPVPRLQLVRLIEDETSGYPVPVISASSLTDLQQSALTSISAMRRPDGPFRIFTPSAGQQLVVLPSWPALIASCAPAAIFLADAAKLPSIVGTKGVTLSGPILLAVDCGAGGEGVKETCFYLTSGESNTGVELCTGASLMQGKGEKTVLGQVLMALLPALPRSEEEED